MGSCAQESGSELGPSEYNLGTNRIISTTVYKFRKGDNSDKLLMLFFGTEKITK